MREVPVSEISSWKYPEWIVLVTSVDGRGRPNVMPASWSMFTSHDPVLYSISIAHVRYTHESIVSSGEFVAVFPAVGAGPGIRFCGTCSGRDTDKFARCSLKAVPASVVGPPLIRGAVANLECRVADSLCTGDHTIFVGEVLAAHVEDQLGYRLLNFGGRRFGQPQIVPGTLFQYE